MTRCCDFVLVISWWLERYGICSYAVYAKRILRVNVSYWNNEVGDVKMYGDLMEDLYVYDDMIYF